MVCLLYKIHPVCDLKTLSESYFWKDIPYETTLLDTFTQVL